MYVQHDKQSLKQTKSSILQSCLIISHLNRNWFQNIQNEVIMMRISHMASDLKLHLVGKRMFSKMTRSISVADIQPNEQFLLYKNSNFCSSQVYDESPPKKESESKYSAIEDTRVSRFTYQKILIVEKNILLLSLLVIFFGMIKLEADMVYTSGKMSQKIMMIMSFVTIILILLVIIRKVLILQLQIDQKKLYIRKNNRKQCRSSFLLLLSYKKQSFLLLTEILAILPHPNVLFQGATYSYFSQYYSADLQYSYNDLWSVLMLAKIFVVFRSLISLTIYSSPRMIRLCRHKDFEYSFFYSIKCIQHQHPVFFISFVFSITLFIFAFGFRVTEGRVFYLNTPKVNENGYQTYSNCVWFTFITMTSLGYGDFTPITLIARLLACMLSIFGLTLNSFLVVTFSQYLKMKSEQIRSHTTLERLQCHQIVQKQAADTLSQIIKVTRYMSRKNLDPVMSRKLKPMFFNLKRKIDSTKTQSHRIRAILPQENKTELMIHEFQVLLDAFKAVFQQQVKTKNKIAKIEEKKTLRSHVHQSFLREVSVLLNKFR